MKKRVSVSETIRNVCIVYYLYIVISCTQNVMKYIYIEIWNALMNIFYCFIVYILVVANHIILISSLLFTFRVADVRFSKFFVEIPEKGFLLSIVYFFSELKFTVLIVSQPILLSTFNLVKLPVFRFINTKGKKD